MTPRIPKRKLPDRFSDRVILEYLARVGAATPDLLGALAAGTMASDLSTSDSLTMHRRVGRLRGAGLLEATPIRTSLKALRSTEHWLYRLTDDGVRNAARLRGGARRAAVVMATGAEPSADGWVDERVLWRDAFPGIRRQRDVRARLNRLVKSGLARRQKIRPPATPLYVALTPAGRRELGRIHAKYGRPPPDCTRAPRLDQAVHHLLVVAAAAKILAHADGRLVRLLGDEDLRSRARSGRSLKAGEVDVKLPDGRLLYRRRRSGAKERVDIEILVSKYTDVQILAKYETLQPQGTLFFAPTPDLCDRTEALVRSRPFLLT